MQVSPLTVYPLGGEKEREGGTPVSQHVIWKYEKTAAKLVFWGSSIEFIWSEMLNKTQSSSVLRTFLTAMMFFFCRTPNLASVLCYETFKIIHARLLIVHCQGLWQQGILHINASVREKPLAVEQLQLTLQLWDEVSTCTGFGVWTFGLFISLLNDFWVYVIRVIIPPTFHMCCIVWISHFRADGELKQMSEM